MIIDGNTTVFNCCSKRIMPIVKLFLILGLGRLSYASPVVVNTACGQVQGTHNISYVLRGIRYAEAPITNKRWTEPVLISPASNNCWSGVYDATRFGDMCVQRAFLHTEDVIGSEDCLFLNIWTPTLDPNAQLDVMAYIPGGSLQVRVYILHSDSNRHILLLFLFFTLVRCYNCLMVVHIYGTLFISGNLSLTYFKFK